MLYHLIHTFKLKADLRMIIKAHYFSLSLSLCFLTPACLPVEAVQPDCFPEEGCPTNFTCVEGRCVKPEPKLSHLTLNCLGQQGCYDQLLRVGFERACLFLEQPEALFAVPFNFDRARESFVELNLAVQKAPLRASVVLMSAHEDSSPCPSSPEEIKQRRFLESCEESQGCLLKLRTLTITSEELQSADPLVISFDGSDGQCIESIWREDLYVEESCETSDLDCDGFVEEGLYCESVAL